MTSMSGTSYCTTDDLVGALTGLNSSGTPGQGMDQTLLQTACDQATAKVSSWTGQIWGISGAGTVIPVPDIIISLTIDVACYYATLAYRKNKPLDLRDPVQLRYNDALSDLKAIQEGQIDPNPAQLNQTVSAPGIAINTVAPTLTPEDAGCHLSKTGRIEPQQFPIPGTMGYY